MSQLVYVFPLEGMVFFPRTIVPLNIFEPRYLKMVADSLTTGIPIALTQYDPLDSEVWAQGAPIAGFGSPQVIVNRPDGTQVILVHGRGRVQLRRVVQATPYIICETTVMEDIAQPEVREADRTEEVSQENRFALRRFEKVMEKWLDEHLRDPEQRKGLERALKTPQGIVETVATLRVKDADLRQEILNLSDINERIELMARLSLS